MIEDFRCNIVTLGKTGSGKSSLLNYLFGTDFKSGAGKPVTEEGLFESEQEVNGQKIRVFDSWGIEADKVNQWKALLGEEVQRHGTTKNPEDWFHAVVYCIQSGGGRIENIDTEIISKFVRDGYRVIVALTKIDQCSPEDEKVLKSTILREIEKNTGKVDPIKVIPVCSEIKKYRDGRISEQTGRNELVVAILDSWIEAIRFRIPSAVIGALKNKLDEFREELVVYVDNQKLSGRPEANEQVVNECRKKISAKMKLLLTDDISIESQRIFESCKRIGISLMSALNSESLNPNFSYGDFDLYFIENQNSFKGRLLSYIASLGIVALIHSYANRFVCDEKQRIQMVISNNIEDLKNQLEEDLKPKLEKTMGEIFEA